ncbi:MAG TPA: hypothetical protein VF815_24320, partial [Myxococcaceae bacterium]
PMIRQYVNLPSRARDHHGSRVRLEVQGANLGPDRVGVTEWWVEPVGANNTDLRYLSAGQRARMRTALVRNRRNTFQNTLLLPHVGGDRHKPRCAKRGDRAHPVEIEEMASASTPAGCVMTGRSCASSCWSPTAFHARSCRTFIGRQCALSCLQNGPYWACKPDLLAPEWTETVRVKLETDTCQ